MSSPDWYRWYPSKYAHGVIGLSPEQRGVYMDIINIILDRGACPEDYGYLAKACNCRVDRLKRIIGELIDRHKLSINSGEIVQERAKNERRTAEELTKTGQRMAHSRWGKMNAANGLGDASGICKPQPQPQPDNKKKDSRTNGAAKPTYDAEFEGHFWPAWTQPARKIAKGQARKAYREWRGKGVTMETILAGVARSIASWQSEGRRSDKTPYPATWLNGECWDDDLVSLAQSRDDEWGLYQ